MVSLVKVHLNRVPRQDQIVQTHVWLVGTMVAANLFLTIAVNVKDSSLGAGCSVVGFLANMSWIAVHVSFYANLGVFIQSLVLTHLGKINFRLKKV